MAGDQEETNSEDLMKKRTQLRKALTRSCNEAALIVSKRGSRTLLRKMKVEIEALDENCKRVNQQICDD